MATELSEQIRTLVRSKIPGYNSLNPEQQAIAAIRVIAKEFDIYRERNLMIKDKMSSKIVPFDLNWAQRLLVDRVLDDLEHGRPIRYIILKARQMGLSTVIEALCYWWTTTHRYVNSVIIAHETEAAGNLYRMFRRYYEHSHPTFQPDRKYNTKKDLVFDVEDNVKADYKSRDLPSPGLASEIKTMVAKEGKGRSDTINFFHGCLHKNSLVVLSDGSSKKIEDILINDEVFTSSGAVALVSAKTMTGIKQTYKVNTWMTNEPIIASADHKVLTIDGYKKVSELNSYDWIAKPKYKFIEKYELSFHLDNKPRQQNGGTVHITDKTFKLDYDFGYLVGYYLAEGHINKNISRVTFTYETKEAFVHRTERFFANQPKHLIEGNRSRTVYNDVFMANALNELAGRVADKHVPLFGNLSFFSGIYRGYMDGDGSKTDVQRERAPSVHERIARNINRIGNLRGTHGSLHYAERERYGVASQPVWTNSFCHGKSSKYKFIDGQCFVRIKSVALYEVAKTYDVEIDHPDHNFETPSGIVSNSEVAFWEAKADVVSSALQAVPLAPMTFVFLESTANGVGGFFYDEWQNAKKGASNLKPLFFAWHEHYEYELEAPDVMVYNEEELELIEIFKDKKYPVSSWAKKIVWRREKMKEFRSDPQKFYQEYPKDDMEAFLASGRPVFDIKQLVKMESIAQQETAKPRFGRILKNDDLQSKLKYVFQETPVTFQDQDPTPLKVWELPIIDDINLGTSAKKYVIAIDVSEGKLEQSSDKKENDYSVIDVMRVDTLKTVARWRGHIDPDLLGEVAFDLGMFYNTALIAPEINNHGLTTAQSLRNKFYRNMYSRESSEEDQFQTRTAKMGWRTDKKTKPIIINELVRAIREGDIIDLDIVFIRECMTYVRDDQGHTNAQEGMFDDTVMAKAINLQMANYMSYDQEYAKESIHKPIKRKIHATNDSTSLESIAAEGRKSTRTIGVYKRRGGQGKSRHVANARRRG